MYSEYMSLTPSVTPFGLLFTIAPYIKKEKKTIKTNEKHA